MATATIVARLPRPTVMQSDCVTFTRPLLRLPKCWSHKQWSLNRCQTPRWENSYKRIKISRERIETRSTMIIRVLNSVWPGNWYNTLTHTHNKESLKMWRTLFLSSFFIVSTLCAELEGSNVQTDGTHSSPKLPAVTRPHLPQSPLVSDSKDTVVRWDFTWNCNCSSTSFHNSWQVARMYYQFHVLLMLSIALRCSHKGSGFLGSSLWPDKSSLFRHSSNTAVGASTLKSYQKASDTASHVTPSCAVLHLIFSLSFFTLHSTEKQSLQRQQSKYHKIMY